MKVIHLIGQLGFGGTERQLYLLLKHQVDRSRVEPMVVVLNPSEESDYQERIEALGLEVKSMPGGFVRRLIALRELVRGYGDPILHSWSPYVNAYAALTDRVTGTGRCIASFRGSLTDPDFARLPAAYRWLCIRGCTPVVVNSLEIEQELIQAGVPAGEIAYIPNCVETTGPKETSERHQRSRLELRRELGLPDDAYVVGMAANLRPRKNHGLAIRAFAELRRGLTNERAEHSHLVIAGQVIDGEAAYLAELHRLIRELGLRSHVHLLGFRENVRSVIAGLDVFCLSSTTEGMPNCVLEAMAEKVVVVATDVGGVRDLITREHGRVVSSDDVTAMSAAFAELSQDAVLRQRLAAAAYDRVRTNHDPSINAQRFSDLYLNRTAKAA